MDLKQKGVDEECLKLPFSVFKFIHHFPKPSDRSFLLLNFVKEQLFPAINCNYTSKTTFGPKPTHSSVDVATVNLHVVVVVPSSQREDIDFLEGQFPMGRRIF